MQMPPKPPARKFFTSDVRCFSVMAGRNSPGSGGHNGSPVRPGGLGVGCEPASGAEKQQEKRVSRPLSTTARTKWTKKKRREGKKTLPGCFPFSRMRKTEVEKIKAEGAHRGNITCVNCGVATGKLLSTCGGAVGI